jgi:hypothetical protein
VGDLVYLFPNKQGECSQELYDLAVRFIDNLDTEVGGHIDRSPPQGGVAILWQTSNRVLEVTIEEDDHHVAFEGSDSAKTCLIMGNGPISDKFDFLSVWLQSNKEQS